MCSAPVVLISLVTYNFFFLDNALLLNTFVTKTLFVCHGEIGKVLSPWYSFFVIIVIDVDLCMINVNFLGEIKVS